MRSAANGRFTSVRGVDNGRFTNAGGVRINGAYKCEDRAFSGYLLGDHLGPFWEAFGILEETPRRYPENT